MINPSTHTVNDVLSYVKRQFGDESGVQLTDADLYRWINAGQYEIVSKNAILKVRATADVVANQREYDFPAQDILHVNTLNYKGRPIQFLSFPEAQDKLVRQDSENIGTGEPEFWYEWAGQFYLWPTPQENVTDGLTVYYVKNPSTVSNATDTLSVPDRYYSRLLEFVLSQAYELDEDWSASNYKTEQFHSGLDSLAEEENAGSRHVYPSITVLSEDY